VRNYCHALEPRNYPTSDYESLDLNCPPFRSYLFEAARIRMDASQLNSLMLSGSVATSTLRENILAELEMNPAPDWYAHALHYMFLNGLIYLFL
jgi:hypothetical protein